MTFRRGGEASEPTDESPSSSGAPRSNLATWWWMDFNERGFLGEAIEEWRKRLILAHQAHFAFAHDVHEFCQRAKFELKVHNRDGQQIVAASLFFKMLSDYQGALILLERGMVVQGQALL